MATNRDENDAAESRLEPPDEWKTGDEPATRMQRAYLETMASEAGEQVTGELTKAEASKRIDELRKKTGRDRDQWAAHDPT